MTVKASSGHRFSLGIINIRTAGLVYSGACDKKGAKLGASTSKARLLPLPGSAAPAQAQALAHVGEACAPGYMEIHITALIYIYLPNSEVDLRAARCIRNQTGRGCWGGPGFHWLQAPAVVRGYL